MAFVPQGQAQLMLRIDVVGKQVVTIGSETIVCHVCDVFPLGETFFVSMDKQLVRIQNTALDLTIDRIPE